jgi:CBS domain-containing protein
MRIKDIMRPHVSTVRPDDTLSLAAQTMLWLDARHLPVMLDGELVGVISDRDILRHRSGWHGMDAKVAEAMSTPPQFAHPDDPMIEAAERMAARKVGCLPVVDRGELIGLVTTTDLLRARYGEKEAPKEGEARESRRFVH